MVVDVVMHTQTNVVVIRPTTETDERAPLGIRHCRHARGVLLRFAQLPTAAFERLFKPFIHRTRTDGQCGFDVLATLLDLLDAQTRAVIIREQLFYYLSSALGRDQTASWLPEPQRLAALERLYPGGVVSIGEDQEAFARSVVPPSRHLDVMLLAVAAQLFQRRIVVRIVTDNGLLDMWVLAPAVGPALHEHIAVEWQTPAHLVARELGHDGVLPADHPLQELIEPEDVGEGAGDGRKGRAAVGWL